ncbi:translation initiation factor IF-2 [Peptoniphilus sp. oral taxon 836 str. F0141]|nr:translation initiation factor IF-2 N-terminal domain-containing protein [Peptoniphilus sp. oral taxon 836]EFK39357.1 translation initiation factor IF-2 [Peptoniphilus sp. oral taxon 836 str. F0141]
MSNIRVHALAKEIGITSKELLIKLKELNIEAKNHMSTIDEKDEEKVRKLYSKGTKKDDSKVKESKNIDKKSHKNQNMKKDSHKEKIDHTSKSNNFNKKHKISNDTTDDEDILKHKRNINQKNLHKNKKNNANEQEEKKEYKPKDLRQKKAKEEAKK